MMDKVLCVEFPPLILEDDTTPGSTKYIQQTVTDYTPLPGTNDQYWVNEHKLDLSGYQLEDLTVYFRNSFEQRAAGTSVNWDVDDPANPLQPFDAAILEMTLLSTVPLTDDNLKAAVLGGPGFIRENSTTLDFGNFNRTQIIHGTNIIWSLDTSFGTLSLAASGAAYCRIIQSQDFSSLEPTASENIYCYRVIYLAEAYDRIQNLSGLTLVAVPAKRVLLNVKVDKEEQLQYMMRLKRSYELANQV